MYNAIDLAEVRVYMLTISNSYAVKSSLTTVLRINSNISLTVTVK